MRSAGQPPADRIVRVFLPCPRHRGCGAMTVSALDSPRKRVPLLPKPVPGLAISRSPSPTPQIPAARSAPKSKRGGGRKPGQPVALSAFLEVSPATRSRESPAAASSAVVIRPSQEPHVSLNPLSVRSPFPATQKTTTFVKKLWTPGLPCGSPRKSKIKTLFAETLIKQFQSLARSHGNRPLPSALAP